MKTPTFIEGQIGAVVPGMRKSKRLSRCEVRQSCA